MNELNDTSGYLAGGGAGEGETANFGLTYDTNYHLTGATAGVGIGDYNLIPELPALYAFKTYTAADVINLSQIWGNDNSGLNNNGASDANP